MTSPETGSTPHIQDLQHFTAISEQGRFQKEPVPAGHVVFPNDLAAPRTAPEYSDLYKLRTFQWRTEPGAEIPELATPEGQVYDAQSFAQRAIEGLREIDKLRGDVQSLLSYPLFRSTINDPFLKPSDEELSAFFHQSLGMELGYREAFNAMQAHLTGERKMEKPHGKTSQDTNATKRRRNRSRQTY